VRTRSFQASAIAESCAPSLDERKRERRLPLGQTEKIVGHDDLSMGRPDPAPQPMTVLASDGRSPR
jgi:hypothetical protein